MIGFGAGEPDFPTPQHIVDAAIAACSDVKNHRYTPAGGLPELKEAIAAKTKRDSGFDCSAVAGARHQRWQARGVHRVRRACAIRATRSSVPPRTGRRIPRRSRSPAASR